MDALVNGLLSGDKITKMESAEKFLRMLKSPKCPLNNAPSDMKLKLMNTSISLLKDANPKIVMLGFDILSLLITQYGDSFQALVNMSFDTLFLKFCDNKLQIRERALELSVVLVNLVGVVPGIERLLGNSTNKNVRIKEHVLMAIAKIQLSHGNDLSAVPKLIARLSSMLSDTQNTVRQLAVETIAKLHSVFGDDMFEVLNANEVNPVQIKSIRDLVYSTAAPLSKKSKTLSINAVAATTTASGGPLSSSSSSSNHPQRSASPLSATSSARSSNSTPVFDFDMVSPASQSHNNNGSNGNNNGGNKFSATGTITGAGSSSGNVNTFDPAYFLTLLNEGENGGTPSSAIPIDTDRNLTRLFGTISTGLSRTDDWQARISALACIQNAIFGSAASFESFPSHIKSIQELIKNQVLDLRSVVSKEACRTIAILAFTLRQQFSPFADIWWPQLVKLIVVKIQVISSAADRCIRIMISSCTDSRLLSHIIDSCSSKSPALRKLALEYLSLCCCIWRIDVIERQLHAIKQVIKQCLSDADVAARKTARLLYWVLHAQPSLATTMSTFMADIDFSVQKHVQTEMQSPSGELEDMFRIMKYPKFIEKFEIDAGSTEKNGSSDSGSSINEPVESYHSPFVDEYVPTTSGRLASTGKSVSTTRPRASSAMAGRPSAASIGSTSRSALASTTTTAAAGRAGDLLSAGGDGVADIGSTSAAWDLEDGEDDENERIIASNSKVAPNKRLSLSGPIRIMRPGAAPSAPVPVSAAAAPELTSIGRSAEPDMSCGQSQQQQRPATSTVRISASRLGASRRLSLGSIATSVDATASINSNRKSSSNSQFQADKSDVGAMSKGKVITAGAFMHDLLGGDDNSITGKVSVLSGSALSIRDQQQEEDEENNAYNSAAAASVSNGNESKLRTTAAVAAVNDDDDDDDDIALFADILSDGTNPNHFADEEPPLASTSQLKFTTSSNSTAINNESSNFMSSSSSILSSSTTGSRRASLGGSASGGSALSNGPKRIVRNVAPAVAAAESAPSLPLAASVSTATASLRSEAKEDDLPSKSNNITEASNVTLPQSRIQLQSQAKTSRALADDVDVKAHKGSKGSALSSTSSSSRRLSSGVSSSTTSSNDVGETAEPKRYSSSSSSSTASTSATAASTVAPEPVFVFSGDSLRSLVQSAQWSERVKAFDHISGRLNRALSFTPPENLSPTVVEMFVDICCDHVADPHNKVAMEACRVLSICLSSFPAQCSNKLSVFVPTLFQRLADRRQPIRDEANQMLNVVRANFDPSLIISTLTPKMVDIPDRMKSALLQFLGAVAPHCPEYFEIASNLSQYLARLASILGSSGSKPSATLAVAGRKLLELTYKLNAQGVCQQLGLMPMQPQILLKKVLSSAVPDIDMQVNAASKLRSRGGKHLAPSSSSSDATDVSRERAGSDASAASTAPQAVGNISGTDSKGINNKDVLQMVEDSWAPVTEKLQQQQQRSPMVNSPKIDYSKILLPNELELPTVSSSTDVMLETLERVHKAAIGTTATSPTAATTTATTIPGASSSSSSSFGNLSSSNREHLLSKLEAYLDGSDNTLDVPVGPLISSKAERSGMNNSASVVGFSPPPPPPPPHAQQPRKESANESINSLYDNGLYDSKNSSSSVQQSTSSLYDNGIEQPQQQQQQQKVQLSATRPSFQQDRQQSRHSRPSPLASPSPSVNNDLKWLIDGFQPIAGKNDKIAAAKDLKKLLKNGDDQFWSSHGSSIAAVLLNVFIQLALPPSHKESAIAGHAPSDANVISSSSPSVSKQYPYQESALTGLSPLDRRNAILPDNENHSPANANIRRGNTPSPSSAQQQQQQQQKVPSEVDLAEAMHLSAKYLLLLARVRGKYLNLRDILSVATTLCTSVAFVPVAVSLQFAEILSLLAPLQPSPLVATVVPFCYPSRVDAAASREEKYENASTRSKLFAMQVLVDIVNFVPASQLNDLLAAVTAAVLPSVASSLADIRKTVIFVLVELHAVAGDVLWTHLQDLTPPQRKLMNIYIERKKEQRLKQQQQQQLSGH